MRVVLDTNIVVSALLWGGQPLSLIEQAAESTITLFTSPALLAELEDVLTRDHLAKRLTAQRSTVAQAVQHYAELAVIFTPAFVPKVVASDPDDDEVIAAAVAAEAVMIISGDADLLSLHPYSAAHGEIAILNAKQALARLQAR